MSIGDRIKRLIRSEINSIGAPSGAEGTVNRRSLEHEFRKLREQEEELIRTIRQARSDTDTWEDRAALALQRKDERLAKFALTQQHKILEDIQRWRNELQEVQACLLELGSLIDQMERPPTQERLRTTHSRFPQVSSPPSTYSGYPPSDPQPDTYSSPPPDRRDSYLDERSPSAFDTRSIFNELDRIDHSMSVDQARAEAESELFGGLSSSLDQHRPSSRRPLSEEAPTDRYRRRHSPPNARFRTSHPVIPPPDPLLDPDGVRLEQQFRLLEEHRQIEDDLAGLKAQFED